MPNQINNTENLKRTDIELEVKGYLSKSNPDDRYTSFDYCYNYFQLTKNLNKDIEKSCLVIGFYLASWGMFRGSSFLLQKSVKHFQPTIQYIANLDKSFWNIDVPNYDKENIQKILELYNEIKSFLIKDNNADLTLITKILLGVFGIVPAFDNYFCNTFRDISMGQCGFRNVSIKSLTFIKDFYDANQETIDKLAAETFTKDFETEQKTNINYPKAKIIDMYGFILGKRGK